MAFIKVDHTKAQQGAFLPEEGILECVIENARLALTRSGTEHIGITLHIRGDVQQPDQGESFNWPVYRLKQPRESDPEGFPYRTIQAISKAVDLPHDVEYDTIDDWMRALIRKPLRVDIRHEEFNGRTQAKVAYCYQTDHPQLSAASQGFIQVDDDEDVPF